MSSSDDTTISLTNGDGTVTGTSTLSGIVNYLSAGGSAATLLGASFLGVIVAPLVAVVDVVQAVATFFSEPFQGAGEALGALLEGLFEGPGDLLTAGAAISESSLRVVFGDTLAGILAFPITVALTLIGLYLVVRYLREDETGDTLPGVPIDVPTDIFGVEEERGVDE